MREIILSQGYFFYRAFVYNEVCKAHKGYYFMLTQPEVKGYKKIYHVLFLTAQNYNSVAKIRTVLYNNKQGRDIFMSDNPMKSNSKAERTRDHFIKVTKQMILESGIDNTSVRKVAETAGYSYATIYNHFEDMEELLFQSKIAMMKDFWISVEQYFPDGVHSVADIKRLNRLHLAYYIENPNVFQFFYQYQIKPHKINLPILEQIDISWKNNFEQLAKENIIDEADVDFISKTIIYTLHGILTLYFSNNKLSLEQLCADLDHITDNLLKRGKKNED